MRALFDYDPKDDTLLPCRELGLPFSQGDILLVSHSYFSYKTLSVRLIVSSKLFNFLVSNFIIKNYNDLTFHLGVKISDCFHFM